MALQLKHDDGPEKPENELKNELKKENDFNAGIDSGERKYAFDDEPGGNAGPDLSNLPPIKHVGGIGSSDVKVIDPNRKLIHKIIGFIVLLLVLGGLFFGIKRFLYSSGEDITKYLSLSEKEIGSKLKITFEQNDEKAPKIQQYSGGKVTVRSGKGLDIVYIDGKQVGVSTSSQDYKFFDIGIKDPQKDVEKKMTFKSDGVFVVANDLMGGSSTSYFYYDAARKNCFVVTVNGQSNRVANMSYFTDFDTVTRRLSFEDE